MNNTVLMQVQAPPLSPWVMLRPHGHHGLPSKHEGDRGKPREQMCQLAEPQLTSCKQSRLKSWFGTLAVMLSPRKWLGGLVWGQRDIQSGASPMTWMLLGPPGHPTLPGSGVGWAAPWPHSWGTDKTTAPAESQGAGGCGASWSPASECGDSSDPLSEAHPLVHFSIQVATSPPMPTRKRRPSRESWRS